MKEFNEQARKLEGINKIEFFGSIIDPNRFRSGKSDVDLIIYGQPPEPTKLKIRQLLMRLSDKYGLQIEKADYLHPVPVYIQNTVAERTFDLLVRKGIIFPYIQEWRMAEKAAPSLTVGERWAGKKHPSAIVRLAEELWS
ncbi:MAG: nucleotidyltransferase domain-containing protein [Solirubrobacteraceae bacterium]|nr:nucleotidyltransferase domain-containing protein [Solirubrobacteraceae bacterium]